MEEVKAENAVAEEEQTPPAGDAEIEPGENGEAPEGESLDDLLAKRDALRDKENEALKARVADLSRQLTRTASHIPEGPGPIPKRKGDDAESAYDDEEPEPSPQPRSGNVVTLNTDIARRYAEKTCPELLGEKVKLAARAAEELINEGFIGGNTDPVDAVDRVRQRVTTIEAHEMEKSDIEKKIDEARKRKKPVSGAKPSGQGKPKEAKEGKRLNPRKDLKRY